MVVTDLNPTACMCVFHIYSRLHVGRRKKEKKKPLLCGSERFPDRAPTLQHCCDNVMLITLCHYVTAQHSVSHRNRKMDNAWCVLEGAALPPLWPKVAGAVWIRLSHAFSLFQRDLERDRTRWESGIGKKKKKELEQFVVEHPLPTAHTQHTHSRKNIKWSYLFIPTYSG